MEASLSRPPTKSVDLLGKIAIGDMSYQCRHVLPSHCPPLGVYTSQIIIQVLLPGLPGLYEDIVNQQHPLFPEVLGSSLKNASASAQIKNIQPPGIPGHTANQAFSNDFMLHIPILNNGTIDTPLLEEIVHRLTSRNQSSTIDKDGTVAPCCCLSQSLAATCRAILR